MKKSRKFGSFDDKRNIFSLQVALWLLTGVYLLFYHL